MVVRNLLIAVVLLVIIGGFLLFRGRAPQTATQSQVTPTQVTTTTPTQASGSSMMSGVKVTLSEQNSSPESGTATLTDKDGKVLVTLEVNGTPTGIEQPAHIHVGACPNPGAVKYPLSPVLNGKSETTLNVTMEQLMKELPLAVNVHKSQQEAKVYVACGDIKAK